MHRRHALIGPLALLGGPASDAHAVSNTAAGDALALLRRGGVVLAMRHAYAPGTFDPPHFKLGDCSTQRNLNDEGRERARALGERLRAAGLKPARVRSSPWCRCMDTAELAFGQAEPWAALGSPRAGTDAVNADALMQLRRAMADAARRPGQFEVWVTHMFVLNALVGAGTSSGEGLVLGFDARGAPTVLARWA